MSDIILNLYPLPKFYNVDGEKIASKYVRINFDEPSKKIINKTGLNFEEYDEPLTFLNLLLKEWTVFEKGPCELIDSNDSNEAFRLLIKNSQVEICSRSPRGHFYGLQLLQQLLSENLLYDSMDIVDFPHMRLRGIIEGFYGKPWSMKDRLEAITTISSHRMNSYIYAPKNDPYHREKWNEFYPVNLLEDISKLFKHCKERYVDFYYTLGPGLSMKYSDEDNFETLVKKYTQLFEIGVRHFGILFDDIPSKLMHEEDKSKFEELASAHAFIVNKLYKRLKTLDDQVQLLVCGTVYYGRGNEAYNVKLGSLIPYDVRLFWTGRSICSQELDSRDAKYFYKNTVHKPLYWDNYPVNDANMQYELHLSPIIGRDCDLYMYSDGIISNVMQYKEASMVPIITICHYLWNCEKYESEKSLNTAVHEIVGEDDFEHFMRFARYCMKSCLSQVGSDEFIEKVIEFKCAANKDAKEFIKTLKSLVYYFNSNYKAAKYLKDNMQNKKLLKEIYPWLTKFLKFNQFCTLMLSYMEALQEKKKLKALFLGIQALSLGKRLLKNPIQMMNIETQILLETGS